MKIRHRLAATAMLLPALLAGCAAAPGSDDPTAAPDGAPGGVPVATLPRLTNGPAAVGFPGDVVAGSVRWGAAIGGNSDPVGRHESMAGASMGLRRTFFGWEHRTGKMVATAKADLAAGRVPWVSIKTPGWKVMASGARDAEIDEMLRALDSLGGPVWLTVHHEPEGGNGTPYPDEGQGTEKDWRAMQIKVRERIQAVGTRNIAFAPILMTWTFNPLSKRNVADWWVDGIWDFAGVDHYIYKETLPGLEDAQWNAARTFYGSKGLKVAVGEWGNRGVDRVAADEMSAFYQAALRSGGEPGRAQVIGLSYFDSGLNSPSGAWSLTGEPLARFQQTMTLPTSIHADET